MKNEIIGTTVAELSSALNQMEDSLDYGEKARLQIVSSELPTEQEFSQMYDDLISTGFHISRPTIKFADDLPITEITLTKGSPQWALLIPIIPTILIVGLVAFGITRIETISKALLPLLITLGVTVIGVAVIATRPPVTRLAEKAIERRFSR